MAPRAWSGPLTIEGVQTGDGRVIAPDACTWAPLPLPLSWLPEWSMHADLAEVAPQIGTIEAIERRDGGVVWGSGFIDDENPDGVEVIRRMDAGMAPHGPAMFVSIDPDDVAYEIIAMDSEGDDEMVLMASARLPVGATFATLTLERLLAPWRALAAAAGEPDPGPEGGDSGVVIWKDSADSIIARFTRMRIRGTTCCAQSAFDEAFIELDAAAADDGAAPAPAESVVAHGAPALVTGLLVPDRPAAEVFAREPGEPDGSVNIDEYALSGYVAVWDSCHTGYTDRCVPPPREHDYTPFRHGLVLCEGDERIPTGAFTWGIPHADLDLDLIAAGAHYADSRHGFADVVIGANQWGIWHAGSLRPGITADDVRILRALSMSGDWRWDVRSAALRLIAGLAVNHPGFPVPRNLTASSAAARRATHVYAEPEARMDGQRIVSLVAAGMVTPASGSGSSGHAGCSCGTTDSTAAALTRIEHRLRVLDARTRPMSADAARAALERIQPRGT